jgi:hypothetical protein
MAFGSINSEKSLLGPEGARHALLDNGSCGNSAAAMKQLGNVPVRGIYWTVNDSILLSWSDDSSSLPAQSIEIYASPAG